MTISKNKILYLSGMHPYSTHTFVRSDMEDDQEPDKHIFKRMAMEFCLEDVLYYVAVPDTLWCDPDFPETRIVFRNACQIDIAAHYNDFKKTYQGYLKPRAV